MPRMILASVFALRCHATRRMRRVHCRAMAMGTGILCATALLLPAVAVAQERASIVGQVTDSTGGVLPGVTVEASSPTLIERTRSVVTDGAGRYALIDLRPGTYAVTYSLAGFRTVRREGIVLEGAFAAQVNVVLTVGAVEETLTVTGASPIVDVQGTQTQFVANRDVLETLPGARTTSSQPYGAVLLVPGVILYRPQAGLNVMTVHGSANGDQRITFEGMQIGQILVAGGGQTAGVGVNDLGQEEVVYTAGTQSAESANSGFRMDAIPKEGGNTFSGVWRAYGASGKLQANNVTEELSPFIRQGDKLDHEWDSNLALGGPVVREKLWWFGALRFQQTNTFVANTFFPDGQQADSGGPKSTNGTFRLTYQMTPRNKLRVSYYRQASETERATLGAGIQPEAALWTPVPYPYAGQAKWMSPVTDRVLLEVGQSFNFPGYVFAYQEANGPFDVQHQYLPSNLRTTATAINPTHYVSPIYNTIANVSYVTGSHAFKTGVSFESGYQTARHDSHGDMAMVTYLNNRPSTVTVRNTSLFRRENLNADLGLFAQDTWTVRRFTLTAGVRFDYFNASVPAQSAPAGRFVPAREAPAVSCLPCWSDWAIRLGGSYDLFGNGKTALKATVGKFVAGQALGLAQSVNPLQLQSEARNWNDLDLNGSALDANGNAQYNEIGPPRNANFGQPAGAARLDPNTPRPTNWEETVSLVREVWPGVSATVGYYHRQFYDMSLTRNLFVDPDRDYTPFAITAPPHPELPNGGGEVIPMYNLNQNKLGAVDSLSTHSTQNTRVYNGFEVSVNARLPRGGFAFGGITTERTETNSCDVANSNPNNRRFCNQVPGFRSLYKGSAAYSLPYELQLSGSFQARPGGPVAANYTINSAIAGVPLTGGGTLTVNLVDPTTRYYDYIHQLDLRVARTFRFGSRRLQGFVEVFNVYNASTVLTMNENFGSTWLYPQIIALGRRVQFGGQFDF